MNSKHIYPLLTLLTAPLMVSLTSCGNEDLTSFDNKGTREVSLEVSISKGDINTRSALNEENGNLECKWSATDQIIVAKSDGSKLGVLSINPEDAGKKSALFKGKLDVEESGVMNLNFLYLGNKTNAANVESPVNFNYASQEGNMSGLSDYDFFSQTAQVSLQASEAFADIENMDRQIAFGHFKLNFPSSISYNGETISITGSNLITDAKITFSGKPEFTGTNGVITTKADNKGDLYITVLPTETDLVFTTTVGNKTYKGTLPSRQWNANEYVRAEVKNGETVTGYAGVPVTMTADDVEYNEYGEPMNNPLAKFAKGNITAVGEVSNDFAEDGDNGALYQWGRNHGFTDNARNHASLESRNDFINWEDAFGNLEQPTSNGQRYWDFYVYSQRGETYYTGTGGVRYDPYSYWSPIILDEAKTYNSIEDLKTHPTKWFMDGRYDQGEYIGNLGGYLFSTCNPDYWVWNDGGDTWSERSVKCGYDANPCPQGWRLPTKEEFEAIAPYENINNQASLESLLKNHSEVRQTKEGIRYVIHWLYRPTYLEIQAIVVSSDFQPSQTSNIVWENNPLVVTRKFPYTGAIMAYGGYDGIDEVDMAYPYHPGVPDAGVFSCVQIGTTGNIGAGMAGYWMEDKGYVFKFTASEITGAKTSYVKIESVNPVTGYAIRPVMDR